MKSWKQKNAAAQKKKQENACSQKFFTFHILTRSIVGVFYEEIWGEMLFIIRVLTLYLGGVSCILKERQNLITPYDKGGICEKVWERRQKYAKNSRNRAAGF